MQLLNVFKLLLFNLCAVRCKYVEAINLRMFDSPSEVVRRTTIHHFHIDHKAPCSPPPPPQFSWYDCHTQEKLEKIVMQNFGGKQGALWSL